MRGFIERDVEFVDDEENNEDDCWCRFELEFGDFILP